MYFKKASGTQNREHPIWDSVKRRREFSSYFGGVFIGTGTNEDRTSLQSNHRWRSVQGTAGLGERLGGAQEASAAGHWRAIRIGRLFGSSLQFTVRRYMGSACSACYGLIVCQYSRIRESCISARRTSEVLHHRTRTKTEGPRSDSTAERSRTSATINLIAHGMRVGARRNADGVGTPAMARLPQWYTIAQRQSDHFSFAFWIRCSSSETRAEKEHPRFIVADVRCPQLFNAVRA
jgi:hypothetical protein